MIGKTLTARLAAVLLAGLWTVTTREAAAADNQPKLEGFWEPPDSQSEKMLEKPQLTDKGKAAAQAMMAALKPMDGVSVGSRYCLPLAQPWNLFQSAPIDIVQDQRETTMMYEGHSLPWHIYTDGRDHSGAAKIKPQVNGHSVGRWEGEAFVVDTIHFYQNTGSPGGSFPGGVPMSPSSHLVARFIPSADGKTMTGRFTVEDTALLAKPYAWEFLWRRSDAGSYAHVGECDPADLANSAH